jgi:hypothetical protein
MLIHKKNYKKAMSQSKYILAMLTEKRNELRQFEQQLSHDVFSVTSGQYATTVETVNAMLREEYDTMDKILQMLEKAQASLDEENKLYSPIDEKSRTAQREILCISGNVQRALAMQRDLLIHCEKLRKLYLTLLEDSLLFSQMKRFDIEGDILKRMEKLAMSDAADLNALRSGLLSPLFLPDVRKSLNLGLVYDRQLRLREASDEGVIDEDEMEGDGGRLERMIRRNNAHVLIIRLLLEYATSHASFQFSDFWEHIKTRDHIAEMTAERLLFLDMLKLYEIGEVDFSKWRGESPDIPESVGEFDLDYCLAQCMEVDKTLLGFRRMTIDKNVGRVSCKICAGEADASAVSMDDLLFEMD